MSMSTGARSLFTEVAIWCVVAAVGAYTLMHYDEMKLMTAKALGFTPPEQAAVATTGIGPQSSQQDEAPRSGRVVEIRAGQGGHYYTQAEINGRSIDVLVDTGATSVFLSYEMAEDVGIYLKASDFTHMSQTANGAARIAPVTLDRVAIGDIEVRNVRAAVAEPGKLKTPALLGMSFLGRLNNVGMRSGMLVLQD
jgi:aspartyl protease family protein